MVDRRHKTEPAEFSYRRSRINKRGFREEVDLNASFKKSPQKQRIRACDAPRSCFYESGDRQSSFRKSRFQVRNSHPQKAPRFFFDSRRFGPKPNRKDVRRIYAF